jgi:type I restriction enzyme S subunit
MNSQVSVQIGEHVSKVQTWSPAREAPDQLFNYIDIGSVSQTTKSIIPNGSILGSDAPSRARQLIQAGDVLVSTVRPNLNAVAYVGDEMDGATASTGFCVLRPQSEKLDGRYLYHWVMTSQFVEEMVRQATGQSYPAVSDKIVKSSLIPLPPLDKQKRIAGILDQADALRRLRAQALDKLSTLGHAIFHEMFGDPYSNPKEFERRKLGEIIKFIGGSQPPKSTFLYEPGVDRVRFVQIRDFRTDEFRTYVPKELAKRPFVKDDVLIGRYGPPVFQILRGLAGTYNVALMKAEPMQGVTNDFVFYLLQEPKLHSYVVANSERTAGQSGVNLKLLNEYPAYLPPSDLLRDFSQCLNAHFETKSAATAHLENAKQLFASLQQRAFRGEL